MPFLLAILSHWTLRPPNFSKQLILIHYVLLAMGHRDNKELEQQQQKQNNQIWIQPYNILWRLHHTIYTRYVHNTSYPKGQKKPSKLLCMIPRKKSLYLAHRVIVWHGNLVLMWIVVRLLHAVQTVQDGCIPLGKAMFKTRSKGQKTTQQDPDFLALSVWLSQCTIWKSEKGFNLHTQRNRNHATTYFDALTFLNCMTRFIRLLLDDEDELAVVEWCSNSSSEICCRIPR